MKKPIMLLLLILLTGTVSGKLITPDSLELGTDLQDFKNRYSIDTSCSRQIDKDIFEFVLCKTSFYRSLGIVEHENYLTFVNNRLMNIYTYIDDSLSVIKIRSAAVIRHKEYSCSNSDVKGNCSVFFGKQARKISSIYVGNNEAAITLRDKKLKHYRIPVNPLLHDFSE